MDANRLFLVYIFVAEGRARGPAIPGNDDFLTFVFLGRVIFAFMGILFEGEVLWRAISFGVLAFVIFIVLGIHRFSNCLALNWWNQDIL